MEGSSDKENTKHKALRAFSHQGLIHDSGL